LDKAFPVVLSLNEVAEKRGYLYAKQWGAYLQGLIHFYRNELEGAIDCFNQALEHKHMLHSRAVIDSMAGLMIAYHAKGKMDKAEDMLSHLSGYAESLDDQDSSVVIWSCKARLSMLQDEKRAASLYLSSVPPPSENMIWWLEIPAVTYCRALIDRGGKQALENGEKLLKQFLQMNKDNHNVCQQIQIMPLLSLVYCRQKRFNEAMKILKHAVKLAEPGGWIRPFCEGGSFMVDMLEEMRKQKFAAGFIMRLLDSIRGGQPAEPAATPPALVSEEPPPKDFSAPQALIEPLTNRELDVLEFLEKRYQNKEIAEKLFISTETVKGHLKNIYQKMSVGGRREAVLEAKRLKII
jgi:LuxR family maltose regulon positive regulatory protein